MTRFFGMMPNDEIKIEKHFGHTIIQAGPNGWSVLWPDHSSDYEDYADTPENNFNRAYEVYKKVEDR